MPFRLTLFSLLHLAWSQNCLHMSTLRIMSLLPTSSASGVLEYLTLTLHKPFLANQARNFPMSVIEGKLISRGQLVICRRLELRSILRTTIIWSEKRRNIDHLKMIDLPAPLCRIVLCSGKGFPGRIPAICHLNRIKNY